MLSTFGIDLPQTPSPCYEPDDDEPVIMPQREPIPVVIPKRIPAPAKEDQL